jgi:ribosomal protein S7
MCGLVKLVSSSVKAGRRSFVEKAFSTIVYSFKFKKKIFGGCGGNLIFHLNRVFFINLPKVGLVSQRRGATMYKLPMFVCVTDGLGLLLKWFGRSLKSRSEFYFSTRIMRELEDLFFRRGSTYKQLCQHNSVAVYNRALLKRFFRGRRRARSRNLK